MNDYMHRCSNDNNPNCGHCGLTEDTLFVLTPIHKMFKNTENIGTLSNHTYKTDRKNLYSTTIRSKSSITTHINKQNKGTSTNHCTNTLQKNKLQSKHTRQVQGTILHKRSRSQHRK